MLTFSQYLGEPFHVNPYLVETVQATSNTTEEKKVFGFTEIIFSSGRKIKVKDDTETVRDAISKFLNAH